MNARAELLLHVLCVCVRALTTHQAVRLLGYTDEANFNRFVRDLVARGLVSRITVWAKRVPEMTRPLFASGLVQDVAERTFRDVLNLAHARWAGLPAVPTRVLIATRKADLIFGVPRPKAVSFATQASHDLAVSEIFLRIHMSDPAQAERWKGEDAGVDLTLGDKTADAAIMICGTAYPETIIECVGGNYTDEKLLAIHRGCNARGLAYELW